MQTMVFDRSRAFICLDDRFYHYRSLTDARRKYDPNTQSSGQCDDRIDTQFWHRFRRAAGKKMATKSPGFKNCGADYPAWLNGTHPTVAEGTVRRNVCINKFTECSLKTIVDVKNCTYYYIYKFHPLYDCQVRYCGSD